MQGPVRVERENQGTGSGEGLLSIVRVRCYRPAAQYARSPHTCATRAEVSDRCVGSPLPSSGDLPCLLKIVRGHDQVLCTAAITFQSDGLCLFPVFEQLRPSRCVCASVRQLTPLRLTDGSYGFLVHLVRSVLRPPISTGVPQHSEAQHRPVVVPGIESL